MERVYIRDFVEELNGRRVVLFVDSELDLDSLLADLGKGNTGHLYRFDYVRKNRLFYIENCDLQDVMIDQAWDELSYLIENGYSILNLKRDADGFYIDIPDIADLRGAE